MSLLSKIGNIAKSAFTQAVGSTVASIGSTIIGGAVNTAATPVVAPMAIGLPPSLPMQFQPQPLQSSMFPALPALGTIARAVLPGAGAVLAGGGRMIARGASSVYKSAVSYCKRHPQWCSTVGGIAAVEAMIGNGQLPVIKRRRGRGISATELKHFRRVAKFTSRYCAPTKRAMKAPAMRGKSSCR